jgi:basic membrane protein A and related proteins
MPENRAHHVNVYRPGEIETMKGIVQLVAAALAAVIGLAACGSNGGGTGGSKPFRVALVVPGALGDKGFFDSAAAGVQRMHDQLGAQTKVLQTSSTNPADWLQNMQGVSGNRYDLVIAGGSDMKDDVTQVAKANTGQKLLYFDDVVSLPNVASIMYRQNEGSFLAGVLAGLVTTDTSSFKLAKGSRKVAVVGGMDIPVINDFVVGFQKGVETVDPSIQVMKSYVGTWSDPQAGYSQAKTMFDQGADIVYAVAGRSGLGVLKASQDAGRYSIGVDADQNGLYPGHVLASMLKRVDNSIFDLAKAYRNGSLRTGRTYVYGLQNDGVGLVIDNKDVPGPIVQKIGQAKGKVASGQIKVPSVTST